MNFLGTDPAKGLKNKGFLGPVPTGSNDENYAGKEAKRITLARGAPLRVYYCHFCGGYHLTSKRVHQGLFDNVT